VAVWLALTLTNMVGHMEKLRREAAANAMEAKTNFSRFTMCEVRSKYR